jgi:K+-transporting ATPase ATPase C chain
MKPLISQLRPAMMSTLILAVVCGGIYPLVVWGGAQWLFPRQANGSLLRSSDGTVQGSERIGQGFTGPEFLHPRPSAAGAGYDAANSGGSNLGPTSQKLRDTLKERVVAYRAENGVPEGVAIPADAVTASGSGLDPHISQQNAELQINRIARVRSIRPDRVREVVVRCTDQPEIQFLGVPGVNVLKVNLALAAEPTAKP